MNTPESAQPTTDRILRRREVLERVPFSEPTLWRMERRGLFPAHIRISPRLVGYRESEVRAWLASRETA